MKTACVLGLAGMLIIADSGWGQDPGGGQPGGGFDPAQMFDRFANGKEVWTRADAANNPWGQGMFDRIAQSLNITNGQITREQFTTYMQQQRNNWGGGMGGGRRGNRQNNGGGSPGPVGGTASPGGGSNESGNQGNSSDQWAERMFQRLDANGDGLLNNDEMPEALRAELPKWDTNKDGFIDLNEYKAYFRAVMQQRMAEGGGWNQNWQGGGMPEPGIAPVPVEDEPIKKAAVYRAGNLPKDIPSWFSQYDTDGDGQIGLYEWKATGESMEKFRQIDRNNDGFLTIDEVMRYDAEQKKNGGGGLTFGGTRVAGQGPPNNQGAFQGRNGGGGNGGGFQSRGNGGGGGRNRNRQGGG
jgi:Ca2+-binding EF-hand superfamily protein